MLSGMNPIDKNNVIKFVKDHKASWNGIRLLNSNSKGEISIDNFKDHGSNDAD
jgi:hypothetical protein